MNPLLRRALVAAVLTSSLLALGACSGSVSTGGYDPDDVAAEIQKAQQAATADLEVSGASCPDDSDPEEGATISCTVTIEGVDAPYTVTFTSVTDDEVLFDLAPAQAIISAAKVVDFLESEALDQGMADVSADCGEAAVVVQDADTTFTCNLVRDAETQEVTLRVKDLEGTVALES